MAKVKRPRVLFVSRLQAILMSLIGLVAGILYAFGGATYELLTGTALAFLALIGMPLLFGVFGFVTEAMGALLYNLAAKWVGGIELDLEQDLLL